MKKQRESSDLNSLPLDDQFSLLLHKKIMNKTGAAKRMMRKYYSDAYRKTGVIPKPLLLAGQGVLEGRKCSGRPRVLSPEIRARFVTMVKASADMNDPSFIFITREARCVKNYHKWLEEEFDKQISLSALYHFARRKNLKRWLTKDDFDETPVYEKKYYFNSEPVFDLIQVDGCVLQYMKIKDENGGWRKPQVIEFFDTGSRYMFILDWYFSESSANSVDLFTKFLLGVPFPHKTIRLRPDRAKGFLNLKRPIHELNLKHSIPDGFFLAPDFTRKKAPKQKAHLESSHRTLHNFEIRIMKRLEKQIVKTEPGYIFKNNKMKKITVTYLDVGMKDLKETGMLELYRKEHNESIHGFSEAGRTKRWMPGQKFRKYMSNQKSFEFDPVDVEEFTKYGFNKINATVTKERNITYGKQTYFVAVGAEKFSKHCSTTVHISDVKQKLLIFEAKDDGVLLGEALPKGKFEKPKFVERKTTKRLTANEVEQIGEFLEKMGMAVNTAILISLRRKGLTLATAKEIYKDNKARYRIFSSKLRRCPEKVGYALFNAFLIDCQRSRDEDHVVPYADLKGE